MNNNTTRLSCLLLLLLLFLHLPTIHALNFNLFRPTARTVCRTNECNRCTASCPSYKQVTAENALCNTNLKFLKRAHLDTAYMKCAAPKCTDIFFKHACGLLDVDPNQDINAQISAAKRFAWTQYRSVRDTNNKFKHNATKETYYEQSLKKIDQCKRMFRHALSVRAYNYRLKDKLQTPQVRNQIRQVQHLTFESQSLKSQLTFWLSTVDTLRYAVRTSPRTMRRIRDAFKRRAEQSEIDYNNFAKITSKRLSDEQRLKEMYATKKRLEDELNAINSFNAHLVNEIMFIQQAKHELFKLLISMWKRLRTSGMKCGVDALGDALSSELGTE